MPFRDDMPVRSTAVVDPLVRVGELFAALDAGRATLGDRAPLRLAAVALASLSGEAEELVARVRAADAELAPSFGWMSNLDSSVRMVLAAALVRTGEPVASFVAGSERAGELMKAAGIRRAGAHGVLAGLVLRRVVGGEPTDVHVERMRAIHAVMKKHHWFLTGPEDLATSAMLTVKPGTPQQIGDHVEAIYRRLTDAAKIRGGDPLQTAAGVLALVELGPEEAADRFLAVATALRAHGVKVGTSEYTEVAVLSFVPRSAERIAAEVADLRTRLVAQLSWGEGAMATSLAANLAFVRLVADEGDARVTALADAKLLLDMQTIVAVRQASGMA